VAIRKHLDALFIYYSLYYLSVPVIILSKDIQNNLNQKLNQIQSFSHTFVHK